MDQVGSGHSGTPSEDQGGVGGTDQAGSNKSRVFIEGQGETWYRYCDIGLLGQLGEVSDQWVLSTIAHGYQLQFQFPPVNWKKNSIQPQQQVLQRVREGHRTVLLVAPCWLGRPWFPDLVRLNQGHLGMASAESVPQQLDETGPLVLFNVSRPETQNLFNLLLSLLDGDSGHTEHVVVPLNEDS
ncbi:hypothetical protein DPX16_5940 [Anabarilius grahami]|uniref:Uncharacterized protein n=1 Tax=Anabarilius grahami TaxID=495550 RepID=A0A3N0Y336_ANAGA|nr:hypothetical protein DPX16_5940 [Anabarilius grahami]